MNWKQITIGAVTITLSWYAMMAVHEAGHCLGAIITGARIVSVVVPLVGFSRTDVAGGRHPLVVVWAGPVVGAAVPLLLLPLLQFARRRGSQVVRFFIGFCLLANGAYIGAGVLLGAGDCRVMLQHGSPLWLLVGFGVAATAGGLYVWHRMGSMRSWFAMAEG